MIAILVLPLFVLNARWGQLGNPDAVAANIASWQVANNGTLDLSEYAVIRDDIEELDRWYVQLPDGRIVSNRAPGLIGIAIPVYAALPDENFMVGPGTVVALLATFGTILIIWHVLIQLAGLKTATVAALTLALGTTTWWVSSSELWPHGPGQLWAALAVVALSRSSFTGVGVAFAFSITTRPLTALFAAFTGWGETWRNRSWKPLLRIGAVSALGAAIVLTYNRLTFGEWSVRGGYSSTFTTGAIERFDISTYLHNVWELFVGLPNGFLTTSPIIGVALVGAIWIWRDLPGWTKSLTLAAAGYLFVHAALNRASGGSIVFYRYPLEAIVLAMPLLTLGAVHLWNRGWRPFVAGAIAVSIGLQVAHVFIWSCFITDPVVRTCLL